jgi:hypothetical protein
MKLHRTLGSQVAVVGCFAAVAGVAMVVIAWNHDVTTPRQQTAATVPAHIGPPASVFQPSPMHLEAIDMPSAGPPSDVMPQVRLPRARPLALLGHHVSTSADPTANPSDMRLHDPAGTSPGAGTSPTHVASPRPTRSSTTWPAPTVSPTSTSTPSPTVLPTLPPGETETPTPTPTGPSMLTPEPSPTSLG